MAQYQSGQQILTGLVGTEIISLDNGGAVKAAALVPQMTAYLQTSRTAATSGQTITMTNLFSTELVHLTQTCAALTVNLPASPNNQQVARVSLDQNVTALTIASTGGATIVGAPSTASTFSAGGAGWIYNTTDTTWYKL